jgi:glycosyltransferase involved in cell wall biosynthesis
MMDAARVVFICQAVDLDDPALATTVRWLEALAAKPTVERVRVLTLRDGRHHLPPGIEVHSFGGSSRLGRLIGFYRAAVRALRDRPDLFLIYQGGPYPLLLLPVKLIKRIPVVQWKAHPVITPAMAFQARWCDDLVFTSTPAAFPLDLPKVRAVGQGVDVETFRVEERQPIGDLIATCRISPRKRVREMIEAVALANRKFGTEYRLNVYGPTLPGDEAYADELERLLDRLDARDRIALNGPVLHERMPALLNGHWAFLNFAGTALDRSVVEAMACGLPVVSTNEAVAEIVPADLRGALITDAHSVERQAATIHGLLQLTPGELRALGERMRAVAVEEHSVDRLFDRILAETQRELWS